MIETDVRHSMSPATFQRIGSLLASWRYEPLQPGLEVLADVPAARSFIEVVAMIEAEGDHGYGSWPRGLQVNGYRYWTVTMGSGPGDLQLVRASLRDLRVPSTYDRAAEVYDSLYVSPEEQALSYRVMETVWATLGDLTGRSVLDIGCGTGYLLDYNTPGRYLGIDPSGPMLDRLVAKYPERRGEVMQAKLEEFVLVDEPFDVVISLFASVSYADPSYIETIPSFARRDGGQWFVMTYDEGYEPLVHTYCDDPHARAGLPAGLMGERVPFPNYMIVAGRHGGAA